MKYSSAFLCSVCGFETERSLQKNATPQKIVWLVCSECQHLQPSTPFFLKFSQFCRISWSTCKQLILKQNVLHTAFLSKMVHKPMCYKCHSHHLLEWDGLCPFCGSTLLVKRDNKITLGLGEERKIEKCV